MNPYELGRKHATEKKPSANPFPELSAKWALYNCGYNKVAHPWTTR